MTSKTSTLALLAALALSLAACAPETGADGADVEDVSADVEDDFDLGDASLELKGGTLAGVDALEGDGALELRGAPSADERLAATARCPMYLLPVCGEDGVTYASPCEAGLADMAVAHPGRCQDDPIDGPSQPTPNSEHFDATPANGV